MKRFIILSALSLLLGVAAALQSPQPLKAAECEGAGQILCEEHETCVNVLFAKFCSREYEYYDCRYCHY